MTDQMILIKRTFLNFAPKKIGTNFQKFFYFDLHCSIDCTASASWIVPVVVGKQRQDCALLWRFFFKKTRQNGALYFNPADPAENPALPAHVLRLNQKKKRNCCAQVSKSNAIGVPGFVAKPGGGGRPVPARHVSQLQPRRLLWLPGALLSSVIDAFRKVFVLLLLSNAAAATPEL